jgi:antitoxin (DNA-binding transcriptional repressor) of toxin-antitoxin stability system
MEVPITQFRRDIFALANRVLDGETITVAYKGRRLQVTTAPTRSDPFAKLEGLQPLQIVNPNYPDLDDAELKAEMKKEMEADWAEI